MMLDQKSLLRRVGVLARLLARRAFGPPVSKLSIGAPEEIRTPDPQIRSLVLYPAELRARRAGSVPERANPPGTRL
jgi:hypothetical protein